MAGEQSGQGGRPTGGGVAEVDRAQAVVLVPVEREGAQRAFQVRGDSEELGYAHLARRAEGARRTTRALQSAHGGLGAQRAGQAALVTREFGQPVQRVAETVRHVIRRAFGTHAPVVRTPAASLVRTGAQHRRQRAVVLAEAPARTPAVRHPVFLRAPQRRRPHPSDLRGQRDPALVLLALAAAERVDVELVLPEPAHEPVAPEPGVTAHIRIATLRKQSDAHERTPDLP